MDENTFNKISKQFQKQIIDIFNNEENLPFILKYYLVKQIWEKIQEQKAQNDSLLYMQEKQQKE